MLDKAPIGIGHLALGHARFGVKFNQIIHHGSVPPGSRSVRGARSSKVQG
jgi:hypothetical protein